MELSLVLDVVVAVLLAATIVFAALLNRRIQAFRANKAEFETMIAEFNEATRRTEGAIQALRMAADQTAKALGVQVERGQALRDELGFLVSRADGLADRVAGRPDPSPSAPMRPAPPLVRPASPSPAAPPAPRPSATAGASPARPSSAAPAPLAAMAAADDEMDGEGGRSKAERDLLKALRELR